MTSKEKRQKNKDLEMRRTISRCRQAFIEWENHWNPKLPK